MSAVAPPLIAPRLPRASASEHTESRRRISAATISSVLLGVVTFAAYAWLGNRVVRDQHLVIFDAASRLAHAFFAFYNSPPKLAAVGFVWPPMGTLVFLPFAAIKPLSTSLLALPLTSAVFGAGLVVVLNSTLRLLSIGWPARIALLALFALNPMIAFYATNGMTEIAYLFFLMTGIHFLLRWYLSRDSHFLVLASVPFALATLTRYELVGYAALAAITIAFVMRRHIEDNKLESSMIGFLVPIVYGFGLWMFFNGLIMHDPLFWFKNQFPSAGGTVTGVNALAPTLTLSPAALLKQVATLNFELFPFAVIVTAVMVALWVRRRDAMTACLTAMLLLNAATTFLLVLQSQQVSLLQLRYNMRAMPIALVAAAWIIHSLGRRSARVVATVVAAAGLAVSIPVTWHMMDTWRYQYHERSFVLALRTGQDLEGRIVGSYYIEINGEKQMARYITDHVHQPNAILTDDSQTLEVMLLSGRPDLFLDRIDHGDTAWRRVLDNPFGRVNYFLLPKWAPGHYHVPAAPYDQIQLRYNNLLHGNSWAHVAYENDRYVLLAIDRCPPAGSGFRVPADCRVTR